MKRTSAISNRYGCLHSFVLYTACWLIWPVMLYYGLGTLESWLGIRFGPEWGDGSAFFVAIWFIPPAIVVMIWRLFGARRRSEETLTNRNGPDPNSLRPLEKLYRSFGYRCVVILAKAILFYAGCLFFWGIVLYLGLGWFQIWFHFSLAPAQNGDPHLLRLTMYPPLIPILIWFLFLAARSWRERSFSLP